MISIWLMCTAALCVSGAPDVAEQQKAVVSANRFLEAGQWMEAVSLYKQLVDPHGSLSPIRNDLDRARVYTNLAMALRTGSRFDLALDASERAVDAAPCFSDAHFGVGLALAAQGLDHEAIKSFSEAATAARTCPENGSIESADAIVMMAESMVRTDQHAEARAALSALKHGSTEALGSAAAVLDALGDADAARTLRRRAAGSQGEVLVHGAHSASGSAQRRGDDAAEAFSPPPASRSEGAALREAEALTAAGKLRAAEAVLAAALEALPSSFHLLGSLALALSSQSRHADAIPHLERALRLQPADAVGWARLLFARAAACDWQGRRGEVRRLEAALGLGIDCRTAFKGDCVEPLLALYLPLPPQLSADISRRACLCAQRAASAGAPPPAWLPAPREAGERLRVGYVTSDIRSHATAYLARSLWAMHDRGGVLAGVFMTIAPPDASGYFEHVAASAEVLEVLGGKTDREVAERVNGWGAHVLVDMNGWVRGERSEALALRPARVQVHYMAFLHSMSCPFLDALVSDPVASPPELAPGYGERLLYLPASFLVTDHRQMAPLTPPELPENEACHPAPAASAPAAARDAWRCRLDLSQPSTPLLANLNALYKVDPRAFALWLRVLEALPAAALWVQRWSDHGLRSLRASADAMGLPPGRLLSSRPPPTRFGQVWNAHAAAADLHLDSAEYNAVTLATDLLWVGVPALTLPGERMCARVGASLAAAAGAAWQVARGPEDLVALAVQLAGSAERLRRARAALEARRGRSRLFDTRAWVRAWESGLRMAHEVHGGAGAGPADPKFHLIVARGEEAG